MGLFSSEEETTVGTSIMRVIEDQHVPDSMLTGLARGIMQGSDLTDAMQEAILNGPYRKFERMYRYAASGEYFYGLPNARVLSSDAGADVAKAAIEAEIGFPVTLDYVYFRPPNNVHLGWAEIVANYGYDPETNELTVLSSQQGVPVYLDDLVAIHRIALGQEPNNRTRGVYGDSPQNGYTPERQARAESTGLGGLVTTQHWREGTGETEGVEIHTVWEDAAGAIQKAMVFVDLSAYDKDQEYYQARYRYTDGVEKVGYWTYRPGTGAHPALDGLFALNYTTPGTYFPFAIFRRHKQNRTADGLEDTEEFKTTAKLLDYIDIDFKSFGESIHENPDIGDVEQAVLLMAVPANSQNAVDMDYLFRFFDRLYEATPTNNTSALPRLASLTALSYGVYNSWAVEIADADFRIVISYDDIRRELKPGQIGEVGAVTNTTTQLLPDGSDPLNRPGGPVTTRYYRKQISDALYEEIAVINPTLRYDIYEGEGVVGGATDDKLLVPIDREIVHSMRLADREKIYYRSLHLVCNSRVTEDVEWYETGIFKAILIIVAVVITVWTAGAAWETLAAAWGAGMTAFAIALVTMIIEGVIANYAFKLIVSELGAEFAFIAAVVLAVWGGVKALGNAGAGQSTWAENLLKVSTGLAKAATAEYRAMTADYISERQAFELLAEQKWAELEEVNNLLNTRRLLDPFAFIGEEPTVIFGEAPEQYYNRTIHAGNVGPMSLDIVENFVEVSLTLPGVHETVGSTFYG